MKFKSELIAVLFLLSVTAQAKQFRFPKVDFNKYECEGGKEIGTENIPPARSQSFSNCFSYAAATLADYQNCKYKKTDCTKLGNESRFSVFDLTRLGIILPTGIDVSDRANYKKLYTDRGGSAYTCLRNMTVNIGRAARESCAPSDVFVAKKSSVAEQMAFEDQMWKKLEEAYENHRKTITNCPKCEADNAALTAKKYSEENPESNLKPDAILDALAEKSYAEFLSRLLVPATCIRPGRDMIMADQSVAATGWPGVEDKIDTTPYAKLDDIINKKEQIAAIEGICMEDPMTSRKECKSLHTLVVHKYCQMCPKGKKGGKDCFPAIKIQNSWGQSWQDEYNGGWVPADSVFGRTGFKENINTLTWLDRGSNL